MVETEKRLSIPVDRSEKIRASYVAIASVVENPRFQHAGRSPEKKNSEMTDSTECVKGKF